MLWWLLIASWKASPGVTFDFWLWEMDRRQMKGLSQPNHLGWELEELMQIKDLDWKRPIN